MTPVPLAPIPLAPIPLAGMPSSAGPMGGPSADPSVPRSPRPLTLVAGRGSGPRPDERAPWIVLVVDDDPQVHEVTQLILGKLRFQDRAVSLVPAWSAAEGLERLRQIPDVALILLDVVMENATAGLDMVRRVRQDLGNEAVRIILRTGQPGDAPEDRVILDYDINDYKAKTELTATKLVTAVVAGLRAYEHIATLQRQRRRLEQVGDSANTLFRLRVLDDFAREALTQVTPLLPGAPGGMACALLTAGRWTVRAAAGDLLPAIDAAAPPAQVDLLWQALRERGLAVTNGLAALFLGGAMPPDADADGEGGGIPAGAALLLSAPPPLSPEDRQILALFGGKVALCFENLLLHSQQEDLVRRRTADLQASNDQLRESRDHLAHQAMEMTRLAADHDRARQAAQAADRAKSAFLANMSHEIRTPMTGILGMTEILMGSALDERQRRCCATIQDSGTALLALLNDVLDLSNLEAGRLELDNRPFDLSALLRDTLALQTAAAARKGVRLALDIDPTLAVWRTGDAARLRQVILNLLGNAVKFTATGEVRVTAGRGAVDAALPADGSPSAPRLRIAVTDSGPGIRPEICRTLFHKFTQADDSVSRRFGGSGLGLAICRELVELMGGGIGVDSAYGIGSTFWFVVPLPLAVRPATRDVTAPQEEEMTPTALPPAVFPGQARAPAAGGTEDDDGEPARGLGVRKVDLRGCRVLLADDNAVNLEITALVLRAAGAWVAVAATGAAALDLAARQPFDILLLDVRMPDMDGMEVSRRLRAHGWTAPILAMTADVTAATEAACRDAGMAGRLIKPFDLDDLLTLVAAHTGWQPPPLERALPA